MTDDASEEIARLIDGPPPDGARAPQPREPEVEPLATITSDEDMPDDAVPSDDGRSASNHESVPNDDIETLAFCARLDQSDTDNGLRLRTYFGHDLLVMEQSGHPKGGGEFLVWTGTHWDIANGMARAHRLAQRIGGLIGREADYLAITPAEQASLDDGEQARADLKALEAKAEADRSKTDHERMRKLRDTIKAVESVAEVIAERRAARRRFGVTSKNVGRINAMMECAAPHVRHPPDAFNADPYLVATLTHTLRFVQGHADDCPDSECDGKCGRTQWRLVATEGHRREDLVTALVPVQYDPKAAGQKWDAFLNRFMPVSKQADKRRTLQQFAGVGLLGVVLQHLMFHYGYGSNGKSVFLETVVRVLGDSLAVSLPPETLVSTGERGAGQASPDIMRLYGKRFLRVQEVKGNSSLQEDFVKRITGGEQVTARTLFKGYVDFQNKAKPHMSGNQHPRIDGTDHGIWRRMLVMHWTEKIAKAEQREFNDVVADLCTEAPAILNWLIAGALDFLNAGFFIAEDVATATEEYRDEMDNVSGFIQAHCEVAPGSSVQAREMYQAYVAYCRVNARTHWHETRFGRTMKQCFRRNDKGPKRFYLDVRLVDPPSLSRDDEPPPPVDEQEVPL